MSGESEDIDRCNVFIKYLPPDVTDSGLYAMFSHYGEILSCKVMVDTLTRNSLGYGFCRFSTPQEAENAINGMKGTRYGNKTLLCKYSNSAYVNNAQPSDNLYVKPLHFDTTEEQLREIFRQFGPIRECKVMLDKKGTSRQIGFVRFERAEDARKAQQNMKGFKLSADSPPLVVKFAETTPQKAARRAKIIANQTAAAARKAAALFDIQQQHVQTAISSMYAIGTPAIPYVYTDMSGNVTLAPTTLGDEAKKEDNGHQEQSNWAAEEEEELEGEDKTIEEEGETSPSPAQIDETPAESPSTSSKDQNTSKKDQKDDTTETKSDPKSTKELEEEEEEPPADLLDLPPGIDTSPFHKPVRPKVKTSSVPSGSLSNIVISPREKTDTKGPEKKHSSPDLLPASIHEKEESDINHENAPSLPISGSNGGGGGSRSMPEPRLSTSSGSPPGDYPPNLPYPPFPSDFFMPYGDQMYFQAPPLSYQGFFYDEQSSSNISPMSSPVSMSMSPTRNSPPSVVTPSLMLADPFGSHSVPASAPLSVSNYSSHDANLFVFHLPASIDDKALYTLFIKFGSLKSVKVMMDNETKESRGFGFVQYYNIKDALRAINVMNGYSIENKHLKVAFKDSPNNMRHRPSKKNRGQGNSHSASGSSADPLITASLLLPKMNLKAQSEGDYPPGFEPPCFGKLN